MPLHENVLAERNHIEHFLYFSALFYKEKMNFWLVKSEPSVYSWDMFEKEGKAEWTGIRNYAARLHMNGMKSFDSVLFYHSGDDMAVVGMAEVTKESYSDPTTTDERWVAVDMKPLLKFTKPVTLKQIKAEKKLKNTGLVRIGRLSVMPLKKDEFDLIVKMGK